MINKLFAPGNDSALTSLGLLVLRLWLGLAMFFNHGLDKLANFSEHSAKFPDPLGIGHAPSLALVTFAETAGALLLAFGLLTRFAAVTLVIDLGVAFVMVHKNCVERAGERRNGVHLSGRLRCAFDCGWRKIFIGQGAVWQIREKPVKPAEEKLKTGYNRLCLRNKSLAQPGRIGFGSANDFAAGGGFHHQRNLRRACAGFIENRQNIFSNFQPAFWNIQRINFKLFRIASKIVAVDPHCPA